MTREEVNTALKAISSLQNILIYYPSFSFLSENDAKFLMPFVDKALKSIKDLYYYVLNDFNIYNYYLNKDYKELSTHIYLNLLFISPFFNSYTALHYTSFFRSDVIDQLNNSLKSIEEYRSKISLHYVFLNHRTPQKEHQSKSDYNKEQVENTQCAAAREMTSAAGSPCQYVTNDNAKQATSNYNHPPEPVSPVIPSSILDNIEDANEEWDDSLDGVFHEKIKPQEIKKALETLSSATLSEDKRRFVYYKVLVYIRYIPAEKRGSKKNFLKWWSLHYNCNWVQTDTLDPFKFRVDKRLMNSQPYEWNGIDMDNANDYYNFAKTVKNTFTQTVINNVAQDGQDFNLGPLLDRGIFLKDTRRPINNGRTFFKT